MNDNDKKLNKYGRPKVNVPTSALERVLNIVSIWGVVIIWANLIASWKNIPDRIPTHFGFSGVPDAWGG
jgi:uncharacterized membrane protein